MLQDMVNWGVSLEVSAVGYLTQTLNIPFYLVKITAVFAVVMCICILIWFLSESLSKKDLFTLDLTKYRGADKGKKAWGIFSYILKYLVLFPIYTVIWGSVFVLFLILLVSESGYANIIFFSTIIIAIIRAMSHFNEHYANELAKTLPFVILVTVMLDPNILTKVTLSINLGELLEGGVAYQSIGFIVFLEWTLRAMSGIRHYSGKEKAPSQG